ncbi:MAG: hypothetical protein LPK07_14405 [Hymenobacteraceae bacterium]|nr:hypothetical protein [Hymenobacteraceae bacterium]
MVCFHSDYLHVEFYEAHSVLISQWYGRCTKEQYREALLRFSQLVRQTKAQYAITDRRMLPPIDQSEIDWTLNDYMSLFCKLPLKRFAYINSFDERSNEQLRDFLASPHCHIPFEVRIFDDLTSAYDWLVSVEA